MSQILHRTLELNGISLHVAEAGKGPLVLFCHGFPESWYAWRHQLPALAEAGYRALAPDLRGYGGSSCPERVEDYALLALLGDLVALLDALDAPRAVIVGNDWGATLAWQAALLRPDRFCAVAAFGVPFMGRAPFAPTKIFPQSENELFYTLYFQEPGLAEAELERDTRQSLGKIIYAASGEAGPRQPGDGTPNPFGMVSRGRGLLGPLPERLPAWLGKDDLDVFVRAFQGSGFRGGLNYYRNLDRNWEQQAAFAGLKVEVPALYAVGERDTGLAIPGMGEIIAQMPNFVPKLRKSLVVEGSGHWLHQEKPAELNRLLLEFLRGEKF